ncbi:MAG: hypothetical protein H6745_30445 [Deltaproteobacteria bacterium]|nr:hypothetical protein [Deltaproteobacteria bacterium]
MPLAERVAEGRAAAELADRAARGRLAFPDVRDALARNARKLPDPGLHALGREPLLRADRELARALPGVHRRAEIYRRGLHRLSALLFGNPVGRLLVLWLILPFGGAAFLLEGLQHTVGLGLELLGHHVHMVSIAATLALGVVIAALIHSPAARRVALAGVRALGTGLRALFLELPRAAWGSRPVRRLRATRAWPWLLRGLLVPAAVTAALAWPVLLTGLSPGARAAVALALFAAAAAVSLSALGPEVAERAELAVHRAGRFLVERFWLGLVRLVLDVFAAVVGAVERALYTVDEALRYREGDPRRGLVLKGVLALPWAVVAYVARFYLNVLLEPKYNPVKHFPTVTVGHKLLLPVAIPLTHAFAGPLGAVFGETLGTAIAAVTVFLLPGLAGFLVWELKETWRIYAANRPATLRPATIGSHGEAMRRLLVPGFHAGTLPRAYRKLRRSLRDAGEAGDGARHALAIRRVAAARANIHHVEEAIAAFVDREPLALARAVGADGVHVAQVHAGASRVRVGLRSGEATWTWRVERVGDALVADAGAPPTDLSPQAADAVAAAFLGLCALTGAAPAGAAAPPAVPWSDWVARWEALRARATNAADRL